MSLDVFKDMNEQQREAIAHVNGPLLVVAGAGSGKTRVITHRIANLIRNHGVRPDRLLAITFTNKAAGEMQERVERLINTTTPWITTFHSAGLRMMKMESVRLGFSHPFTVMDEDDQRSLYRRIYRDLKLDPKVADPRKVQWTISRWKNELVDIPQQKPVDDLETVAIQVHARYCEVCTEECVVDFDDLLVKPVRMFEQDDELRRKWVERFPHILIDEYQDTNKAQYRLIRLLGEHRNVCATGDPDQAIYGWRGADIANILTFETDFAPCKTVLLEQNYRSTKTILRAAQGVVANNLLRKDKTIRTDNAEGRAIAILAVDDEVDESFAVAAAIERMLASGGRNRRDLAVFYRTNAQSRVLEDGLRRRGIPYRIVGGMRFYDRREVKDVLAYLKLLINPADRSSWERISGVPKRGIGDRALETWFQIADEVGVTPGEVIEQDHLLERFAVGRQGSPVRELARCWKMLRSLPQGDPAACVRGVIELAALVEHYTRTEEPAEAQDRVQNIQELITAAEQYRESFPNGGLPGFLELVSLNTDENRGGGDEDVERVTLMTLHAAKGLEFPVVFITGVEDGVLPLKRNDIVGDLEEERRLMYVGITRAMHELYLSRARCRMQWGRTFRNQPSQFLAEIPETCFQAKDATGRRQVPEADAPRRGGRGRAEPDAGSGLRQALASGLLASGASLRGKSADDGMPVVLSGDPFRPGDRIRHQVFGGGTIIALKGPPETRAAMVSFDEHGEKELQLAFALAKMAKA